MHDQTYNHERVLYILSMLSKKRGELLSLFLERDPDMQRLSFKYEGNQSAFNIVKDYFYSLWVDSHFLQIINDEIAEDTKNKALAILSELIGEKSSLLDDSQLKHSLLQQRMKALGALLEFEDVASLRRNETEFSYEKTKALFEREFKKYENELRH